MTPAPERQPVRPRIVYAIMRASARLKLAEPEILGLEAVVRRGDHAFDVGAAYGMYTFPLAHLVGPGGGVHSFEPQRHQKRTIDALRSVIGASHVLVTEGAVGAEPGEHSMRLPYRFGMPIFGHTHVATGTERALTPQATHVRTWTTRMSSIDSWCDEHDVDNVTFLKVDVEGFEPNVLEGAVRTIGKSHPSMLLEIEDRHIGRYGRDANAFADEIRSTWPEYRMYTWVDSRWQATERVVLGIRNYLFATDAAFAPATL